MELENSKYAAVYKSEIEHRFTPREAVLIWDKARSGYQKLLADHSDLPPKAAAHADSVIFPAVAIYRALRESCPERAMGIMEQGMAQRAAKVGRAYARLVSLPGMKGVFLKIFAKGAKSSFGEQAGFGQEFLTESSRELAFNITKCPYWDFCRALGCPELAHIFCKSDEYAYGALPGIRFIRTQTLGTGGSLCDFRLKKES